MRVFAYLDPGSGSVLLQALLGGFAAVMVSIKMFGKRVFRTLTFWKRHDAAESAEGRKPARTTTAAAQRETEKEPV
jgi:hypothetical protein